MRHCTRHADHAAGPMVAERRAEVVDHGMAAGLLTDDMSAVADEPKLVGHGCFADGERSPSRRSSAASASGKWFSPLFRSSSFVPVCVARQLRCSWPV